MADEDAARRQENQAYSGHESRPTLPQSPPDEPIVVHGVKWRLKTVLEPIGGVVARRTWPVRSITGDLIFEGGDAIFGDNRRTPYEYFMAIFPPDALMRIVMLTSEKLREKGKQVTRGGEILKFFGILILGTRYEFGSRADLWSTSSRNILFDPPKFGRRTGHASR
jgi:Transposase IS4